MTGVIDAWAQLPTSADQIVPEVRRLCIAPHDNERT